MGTAFSLHSDGHSCAEQQYKREFEDNRSHPRVYILLCFRSLDSFRCSQTHRVDEEDQRLHIKYPLRKEVEAGTSFIADTAHLSHPTWLMIEVVIEKQ